MTGFQKDCKRIVSQLLYQQFFSSGREVAEFKISKAVGCGMKTRIFNPNLSKRNGFMVACCIYYSTNCLLTSSYLRFCLPGKQHDKNGWNQSCFINAFSYLQHCRKCIVLVWFYPNSFFEPKAFLLVFYSAFYCSFSLPN